jgi:hypothetical protein
MRLKILARPTQECIEGIPLDQFHVGQQYEVGTRLGALLLCEGWAEPVEDQSPARLTPLRQRKAAEPVQPTPPNVIRDTSPPHYAGREVAMDRSRRRTRIKR